MNCDLLYQWPIVINDSDLPANCQAAKEGIFQIERRSETRHLYVQKSNIELGFYAKHMF